MCLHEENFSLFLLAKCIQLEHLDQALARFFDDCHLKVLWQKLHTDVEIAKYVVNMSRDFTLTRFDNLVETTEQMVIDIEKEFYAPFLFVGQHGLDQLVCFIDDSVLA